MVIDLTDKELCGGIIKHLMKGDVNSGVFLSYCNELKERNISFDEISVSGKFYRDSGGVMVPIHIKLKPNNLPKI